MGFYKRTNIADWWFGTCSIFPHTGNNHPNWRSHIFQRGLVNHQPESHRLPAGRMGQRNPEIRWSPVEDDGVYIPLFLGLKNHAFGRCRSWKTIQGMSLWLYSFGHSGMISLYNFYDFPTHSNFAYGFPTSSYLAFIIHFMIWYIYYHSLLKLSFLATQ